MVVEAACYAVGEIRDFVALSRRWSGSLRPTPTLFAGSPPSPPSAPSATASGLPAILAAWRTSRRSADGLSVALAAFDGPEPDAALRRCLKDLDWQVRQAAEDLLGVSADED